MEQSTEKMLSEIEATPTELLTELNAPNIENITSNTTLEDFFAPDEKQQQSNGQFNSLPQGQGGTNLNAGSLIDAGIAADLFDTLIPFALTMILKAYSGRIVAKSRFQASAKEKETIKPVLQSYLKSINFNVNNPFNALLLVCAVIYGPKAIDVLNEPQPKNESLKQPIAAPQQPQQNRQGEQLKVVRKAGTFSSTNQPARKGRPAGVKNKK